MHKVLIQSLSFSFNEQYLSSLGGIDDKNTMIVWDVEQGKPLYGSPLGNAKEVTELVYFHRSDDKLIAV
jgi:WD40 repeat protein